uniref:Uncharacterized protein n=1 Tax=Meloidogyne incognita TaxID=6306 RepID=A0A914M7S7_MELIC
MAELDDDYDDRKLRNERKLAEYYQIRKDSEIKQAETDELHNIIEEEMSELDEIQRKIDAKTKRPNFWGNFWKAAKEVKEKIIETTSEYLDFSGHNYYEDSESTENVKKQENETTSEPESEIINVTERLSNIGNDNLKHREELFSSASTSSKTNPSAQDENDEQQLFDSKMQELDQITRNNNIRKAVVEEDFNFIRKQRSEYFERFKKLDAKTKKPTFWGNFWKAAKEVKEKIIETTSEYLDFSGNDYDEDSESTENVEKKENETTSEPESEIINVTERLSNIGNDNLKQREELFNSASKSSKTDPSAQNAGSGVYVENRKNDTTNQPESEIGNVTEKLNKTENDSVKHQEKLLHKTTTIENEIFYKQGTSKQNDVEVNNSQHKENVPIIDQGIPGTVGNILINQNFTGLNLKDKLDKADELLKSARSADKKIENEEEHIKQNQEILNNIGANIEKMEQGKIK